jgi:ribosomal subunit interface protein
MQMIITGRHCHVDQELRDVLEKRFEHLKRFEPRVSRAEVTVTAVKNGFEAEALLSIDRADRVHARAEATEMRSALDRVVEKLGVQLRRSHDRHRSHRAPPMDELFSSSDDMPGNGAEESIEEPG